MSEITRFLNLPGLRGLDKDEIDRIAHFLKTPGKDEFFLLLRMPDKTPSQVRSMMIDEFVRRFGLETRADAIREAFPSRRSWPALAGAMAGFAGALGVEEHRRFWERMRHVLEALPRRKDCGDAPESGTVKAKRGWNYAICKFCWRRVCHNPGVFRKTGSLCFKHNLPAMHPIYRKHRRLESQFPEEQQAIVERMTALVAGRPSEQESHEMLFSQLTAPDGCLPHLAAYLHGVGHDGTRVSLLWAFHGPASDIRDSRYKDALNGYIRYALAARDILDPGRPMPVFGIDELSRAEAWLTLLERDGRGR